MLGVSRPIYVNVDSPNLGIPYFNFLGGTSEKNTLYHVYSEINMPLTISIKQSWSLD